MQLGFVYVKIKDMPDKKLRIGWFTFTCCEDSTIVFTELLNTHYREWLKTVDFVHFKALKTHNVWSEMDVAFVEGAISNSQQEKKLLKIRSLSKKLVAVGACACTGLPSAQRNTFDGEIKAEIKAFLNKYEYHEQVKTLAEFVTVDDKVQGCPMTEQQFLLILGKYLKEFNIQN